MDFAIVNAHEEDAILTQKFSRQDEAGQHHGEPVTVTPGRDGATRRGRPRTSTARGEAVRIDERSTGVIRGIDIDHPDRAAIIGRQNAQRLQIVSFNEKISRGGVFDGLVHVRRKVARRRYASEGGGLAFARPIECERLRSHPAPSGAIGTKERLPSSSPSGSARNRPDRAASIPAHLPLS